MLEMEMLEHYLRFLIGRFAERVIEDERGSATAEQIVMIAAAVVGAVAVAAIIWNKMRDGANSVQTPTP